MLCSNSSFYILYIQYIRISHVASRTLQTTGVFTCFSFLWWLSVYTYLLQQTVGTQECNSRKRKSVQSRQAETKQNENCCFILCCHCFVKLFCERLFRMICLWLLIIFKCLFCPLFDSLSIPFCPTRNNNNCQVHWTGRERKGKKGRKKMQEWDKKCWWSLSFGGYVCLWRVFLFWWAGCFLPLQKCVGSMFVCVWSVETSICIEHSNYSPHLKDATKLIRSNLPGSALCSLWSYFYFQNSSGIGLELSRNSVFCLLLLLLLDGKRYILYLSLACISLGYAELDKSRRRQNAREEWRPQCEYTFTF